MTTRFPFRSKFKVDNSDLGKMARTYDGRLYASKMEMNHARELDFRKRTKAIKDWSHQPRYPMVVNGVKICTYVADFLVTHDDGTVEIQDIKGVETDVFKVKAKLFEALYPELKLSIIKK